MTSGAKSSPPRSRERIAIVGGGIVGLANAWAAARRGHEVLLFERDAKAMSASIRNFGMVWPIGQAPGRNYQIALESRALWCEFLESARLWHRACGSIHLAYRDDELAVLAEFADRADSWGYDCRLLTKTEVTRLSAAAREEGLLGGLWSGTEICVDPRQVIAALPAWLAQHYGVTLHFGTVIARVEKPWVVATDGRRWQVDRVIVSTGADLKSLYPDILASSGIRPCKLQMMRTVPQPGEWCLGPMLAGGLTLRHYRTFGECPSLGALKHRISEETPELERFGIHVMASQTGAGEVTIGDSHEYGDSITPFDKSDIEALILREIRKLITLPTWEIAQRWHGIQPSFPGAVQFEREAEPGVTIVNGAGGSGMTMSFGLAEQRWRAGETPESSSKTWPARAESATGPT